MTLGTFSHWRDHVQHNAYGAGADAGDGDAVGISSESRYVALHPFQRNHLVLHAVVARRELVACAQET